MGPSRPFVVRVQERADRDRLHREVGAEAKLTRTLVVERVCDAKKTTWAHAIFEREKVDAI